jgi:uncharacterized damage-inducible protein DinB
VLAEALRTYYGYNRWATERVLDATSGLPPEQLHLQGNAGRGSIHETLVHLIGAQRRWLSWWDGSLSAEAAYNMPLDPTDYPDVASLKRLWAEVERQTLAFVAGLKDEDPDRVYGFDLPNGQRWEMALWGMMLHVANHGVQHRAEVAAMLTGFGHSPGDMDLIFYLQRPADAPPS